MGNDNISLQNEDASIDLKGLLFKYLMHWKWFLCSLIIFLIAAKLYLRYSMPQYKATTSILIKEDDGGGVASELSAFKDLDLFSGAKNDLDDEIEILKSRTLIENTIKDGAFNISYVLEGRVKSSEIYEENPVRIDFKEKHDDFFKKDTILSIKIKVSDSKKFELFDEDNNSVGEYTYGQIIDSKVLGKYVINLTGKNKKAVKGKVIISLVSLQRAIDYFKAKLIIAPINKNTNVLEISYIDPVKEKAKDFLDRLVMIYNNEAILDKNLISEKTAKFINERLAIITTELAGVEKEAELYKKKNRITDLPTEAELYLKNASDFKKGSMEVGTELKVIDFMLNFLNKNKEDDIIPANIIPNDNSSSAMIAEYNNLVIERDRILKSSTIENPVVIRANEKIQSIKSNIYESLNKLKSSLSLRNGDINNQDNIVGGRISQIPRQEREYRGIFRQQQIKEELFLYLFKKREETAITLAGTAPISKVVDLAYSSDLPVSPKRILIYLIAILFGLVLPFTIIYLLDLFDTKVKNRHDIESNLSIPYIGDVPHSESKSEIIQSSSRTSSAEAIRIVRTNIEFILNDKEDKSAKTIFLTSTLSGEGKTFIAVNLAATIAISGKKTLLIGMDIRNPKLDEYVKLPAKGLTNFLTTNDSNIKDFTIKQKGYESFDILPAGIIPPNPAELLMSKKVESMFEELKQQYDYIVVDTAPVSLVTDTLLISKNADAFIYVVRSNYLEKEMLKIPKTLYKENKLPNMCVLLNDTDSINSYGYGYGQQVIKKPWYKKIFSLSIFG